MAKTKKTGTYTRRQIGLSLQHIGIRSRNGGRGKLPDSERDAVFLFAVWTAEHGLRAWLRELRRGYIAAWEAGLMGVVVVQEWARTSASRGQPTAGAAIAQTVQLIVRHFDSRTPSGVAKGEKLRDPDPAPLATASTYGPRVLVGDSIGPELPDDKPTDPLCRDFPKDYQSDPSWTNGGFAGFHPLRVADEDEERKDGPKVWGVPAFKAVERVRWGQLDSSGRHLNRRGIPELAWFYCAAHFELGIRHTLNSDALALGPTGGSGLPPTGPGDHEQYSARMQGTIRAALAHVELWQQAVIQVAYTDRRVRSKLVRDHGHGIAALLAWSDHTKDCFAESEAGAFIGAMGDMLRALSVGKPPKRPAWHPLTASQAKTLLESAHEAYRVARARQDATAAASEASKANAAKKKRPKPAPTRRRTEEMIPKQAVTFISGQIGTAKRRLYAVPELPDTSLLDGYITAVAAS